MRIEEVFFEITFTADRAGKIKHIVKQPCEEDALDRIRAAYPGQTFAIHKIRKQVWVRDTNSSCSARLKANLKTTTK
ncbi:hypothetical protein RKLH11_4202 [Rhodobacteraceae bacterium KLH11]|nr:hypothetical protein RKLH11_4202 [Rhodobacteraceae bacterium KLH11]